ncbi:MAG: ribosome-associated translation inhibitor RaiA [Deinococcus sp.]|nr:ribosome-associated translation inhibitor RaiA [Deinococcus sp.]MCL5965014.1 ribosome-associated translation inhibitor RaiA [Deinococcus sp.]
MNVYKLVGRQVEITDAIKGYLDKKLSRLDRFFPNITDARVVLSLAQGPRIERRAKSEIQINVPGGIVRVEEADPDMYAAIDRSVERLETQLKRYKERHWRRYQEGAFEPTEPAPAEEETPQVVKVKRFAMRPMSVEDAIFQIENLGHDFFVFRSADTEEICVLYRRKDGNYGLIEPGA